MIIQVVFSAIRMAEWERDVSIYANAPLGNLS